MEAEENTIPSKEEDAEGQATKEVPQETPQLTEKKKADPKEMPLCMELSGTLETEGATGGPPSGGGTLESSSWADQALPIPALEVAPQGAAGFGTEASMEQEITSLAPPTPMVQPFDLAQLNAPYRPTSQGTQVPKDPFRGLGLWGMLTMGCYSTLNYSDYGQGITAVQRPPSSRPHWVLHCPFSCHWWCHCLFFCHLCSTLVRFGSPSTGAHHESNCASSTQRPKKKKRSKSRAAQDAGREWGALDLLTPQQMENARQMRDTPYQVSTADFQIRDTAVGLLCHKGVIEPCHHTQHSSMHQPGKPYECRYNCGEFFSS